MSGQVRSEANNPLEASAFQAAAQAAGVGVAMEEGGYLKLLNQAAKSQLLFEVGQASGGVGRCKIPLDTLQDRFRDPEAFTTWRDRALTTFPEPPEPGRFWTKTGRFLHVDLFTAADGEDGAFAWAIRDRTGRQTTEDHLHKAAEAETAARVAKTHLLAMMSHEVRSPMNAILGMTELLLHTPLSREQWNLLDTARTAGESLIGILDSVLDISKIESGTLPLGRRVFCLADLVEGLVEEMALSAAEAGLEVFCNVDPEIPSILEGDPDKIRQVLGNLLGNAVKFTRQGSVSLSAALAGQGEAGPNVCFSIEDTGPGIRSDSVDRVFEPFFQAGTPEHGDRRGVGLGLSIVRSFVELMGGTIELEGQPGKGTRFDVVLPLLASESEFPKRRASDLKYPEFRGILLSPAERMRNSAAQVFTSLGITYSLSKDAEALEALLQRGDSGEKTVVFVDLRFGEADLHRVRHHFSLRATDQELAMVVLVSPGYENVRTGPEPGRTLYLPKPLTRRGVAGVLQELQGKRVAAADYLEPVPEAAKDLAGLRVLLVEDREENRQYLSRVLEGAGIQVDTASDGETGLIQYKTGQYDLVLTDLDMPRLDGFRLLEEIRREEGIENRRRVPVVAVTAHTDDATSERCFRTGMDAFVLKPVARNELLQVVADLARTRPLILIVEDDPKSQELACQILIQKGYRAEGVGTGEAAVRRVRKRGVSAVLLDMSLPDISGLDVVRRIRNLPQAADLPVIGVTGHVGADQADLCREAGCTAFVEKPVRWEQLTETLEALLSREKPPVFSSLLEGLARLEAAKGGTRTGDKSAETGPMAAGAKASP